MKKDSNIGNFVDDFLADRELPDETDPRKSFSLPQREIKKEFIEKSFLDDIFS